MVQYGVHRIVSLLFADDVVTLDSSVLYLQLSSERFAAKNVQLGLEFEPSNLRPWSSAIKKV